MSAQVKINLHRKRPNRAIQRIWLERLQKHDSVFIWRCLRRTLKIFEKVIAWKWLRLRWHTLGYIQPHDKSPMVSLSRPTVAENESANGPRNSRRSHLLEAKACRWCVPLNKTLRLSFLFLSRSVGDAACVLVCKTNYKKKKEHSTAPFGAGVYPSPLKFAASSRIRNLRTMIPQVLVPRWAESMKNPSKNEIGTHLQWMYLENLFQTAGHGWYILARDLRFKNRQ